MKRVFPIDRLAAWLAEDMEELRRREKAAGIEPDWDIDAYMKALTLQGKRQSVQTEYILSILGLDVSPQNTAQDLIPALEMPNASGGHSGVSFHRRSSKPDLADVQIRCKRRMKSVLSSHATHQRVCQM